ncbi:hypothetical protein D9M69_573090 [compost metagenome]
MKRPGMDRSHRTLENNFENALPLAGHRRPCPRPGRSCCCASAAGARDPLRPPEQRRPPRELRRQALCRTALGQERRQDEGPGVPRLPAGQRDAAAVGPAGRRAADVCAGHHVARRHRQGVRPRRLPLLGQQLRAGRCAARWSARPGADRQAPREGSRRARLLGPGLSQRDEQQAPDHQA